jgi:hypothetical protein
VPRSVPVFNYCWRILCVWVSVVVGVVVGVIVE